MYGFPAVDNNPPQYGHDIDNRGRIRGRRRSVHGELNGAATLNDFAERPIDEDNQAELERSDRQRGRPLKRHTSTENVRSRKVYGPTEPSYTAPVIGISFAMLDQTVYAPMPCPLMTQKAYFFGDQERRWTKIVWLLETLANAFSVESLELSVEKYLEPASRNIRFYALRKLFASSDPAWRLVEWKDTIRKVIQCAIDTPRIFSQRDEPVRLLQQQHEGVVSVTRLEALCILCNGFLSTFPSCLWVRRSSDYPCINFDVLLSNTLNVEKVKCLLLYFKESFCRAAEIVHASVTKVASVPMRWPLLGDSRRPPLQFYRQCLTDNALFSMDSWLKSTSPIRPTEVFPSGAIEDAGGDVLQVDFANRFIGGGVLHTGCVQEEIRFTICPEMIVAMWFTEKLDANEAFFLRGCERFTSYSGYAFELKCAGLLGDHNARGRNCEVVAIDATPYSHRLQQFRTDAVHRELIKAFAGYKPTRQQSQSLEKIATGNWGCGAFGDLIQLVAASAAGRSLQYYTFDEPHLAEWIKFTSDNLVMHGWTVGETLDFILRYVNRESNWLHGRNLFEFLQDHFSNKASSCSWWSRTWSTLLSKCSWTKS